LTKEKATCEGKIPTLALVLGTAKAKVRGKNYIVCPHSYILTNGLYGVLPLFISSDWTTSCVWLNKNIFRK